MKKKFIIIIILLICILFISGITYSKFNSNASLIMEDQKVASFIFEGKNTDSINLSLDSLLPGDSKDYLFSVSNNNLEENSEVSLNYQIIIKTYHFIPLNINLYRINDNKENIILTCDESYSRNSENALVCNSSIYEMSYKEKVNDSYKLNVNFPKDYDSSIYSNIIDYIDIEIKSWQKQV